MSASTGGGARKASSSSLAVVGALIIGLGPTIVNLLFNAGQGG